MQCGSTEHSPSAVAAQHLKALIKYSETAQAGSGQQDHSVAQELEKFCFVQLQKEPTWKRNVANPVIRQGETLL